MVLPDKLGSARKDWHGSKPRPRIHPTNKIIKSFVKQVFHPILWICHRVYRWRIRWIRVVPTREVACHNNMAQPPHPCQQPILPSWGSELHERGPSIAPSGRNTESGVRDIRSRIHHEQYLMGAFPVPEVCFSSAPLQTAIPLPTPLHHTTRYDTALRKFRFVRITADPRRWRAFRRSACCRTARCP
jgi:hypothetical protein